MLTIGQNQQLLHSRIQILIFTWHDPINHIQNKNLLLQLYDFIVRWLVCFSNSLFKLDHESTTDFREHVEVFLHCVWVDESGGKGGETNGGGSGKDDVVKVDLGKEIDYLNRKFDVDSWMITRSYDELYIEGVVYICTPLWHLPSLNQRFNKYIHWNTLYRLNDYLEILQQKLPHSYIRVIFH